MENNALKGEVNLISDKSKEFSNITGLIADKISKSPITINNNQLLSCEQKNDLLQKEILELNSLLIKVQQHVIKIDNHYKYNDYPLNTRYIIGNEMELDIILTEKGIDYQRICDYQNFDFIIYKINKIHWNDFIKIIKEFKKEQKDKQEIENLKTKMMKNQNY